MTAIRTFTRFLTGEGRGEGGAAGWRVILILGVIAGFALLAGFAGAALGYETGIMDRIKGRLAGSSEVVARSDVSAVNWRTVETVLQTLQTAEIPVGHVEEAGNGGGIAEFNGKLVFVTGHGSIGVLDHDGGQIYYLDQQVPMNLEALKAHPAWDDEAFFRAWFRVHHMRIRETSEGAQEMYVSYNHYEDGDACTRLSRIGIAETPDGIALQGDWHTFYQSEPCVNLEERKNVFYGTQSGGRLLFQEDGTVLKTVGDYGFGAWTPGAFKDGALGDWSTLLKIDPETGEKQVVATGFRNAQGLAADNEGRIWSTEHGPKGGDEINLIKPGVNYGWPIESYGMEYGLDAEPRTHLPLNPDQGRHRNYEPPIYAFMPSVGLSNLVFLPNEPNAFDRWGGDALVGSLNGNALFRTRVRDSRVVYTERIPLGQRLRDIILLKDGRLAVWTDARSIILIRDPEVHATAEETRISGYDPIWEIEASLASGRDVSWRREVFQLHCGQCHTVNGEPSIGPSLHGIEGRAVAADEHYPYSVALAETGGKWNRSRLKEFVRNPAAAGFTDSAMQGLNIEDYLIDAALDYATSRELDGGKRQD